VLIIHWRKSASMAIDSQWTRTPGVNMKRARFVAIKKTDCKMPTLPYMASHTWRRAIPLCSCVLFIEREDTPPLTPRILEKATPPEPLSNGQGIGVNAMALIMQAPRLASLIPALQATLPSRMFYQVPVERPLMTRTSCLGYASSAIFKFSLV
jgi:hypothetical protein